MSWTRCAARARPSDRRPRQTEVVQLHIDTGPGQFDRFKLGTSIDPISDVGYVLVTAGAPTSWLILS